MDQDLCEHLYVRHVVDSKKTGREHRPEKPYKKWKRRWVVLSANISPSKCSLNYCKKETDWLSNKQSEISKCQLTSFSVQKFTGHGEHDNHLIISLRAYAICLSFESVTKMEQWYKALERMLECYQVLLECPEHKDLEGEHVIQFSPPAQFKIWGMSGHLEWEWSLQDVRRVHYHQTSDQLEIEVGRCSKTGEGMFVFTGQLVFKLFLAVKEAMKASSTRQRELRDCLADASASKKETPPQTRPPSQSSTHTDQFYGSVSGRSECSVGGASLGRLSIVSAPEMVRQKHSTFTRSPSSVSSPPSPEATMRRVQSLNVTRGSPSQPRGMLAAPPLPPKESAGEYMPLRYHLRENPVSDYVELCRDPLPTPPLPCPRDHSVTPEEETEDGEYIHPHQFYVLPARIDEEDHSTATLSLDSDDST